MTNDSYDDEPRSLGLFRRNPLPYLSLIPESAQPDCSVVTEPIRNSAVTVANRRPLVDCKPSWLGPLDRDARGNTGLTTGSVPGFRVRKFDGRTCKAARFVYRILFGWENTGSRPSFRNFVLRPIGRYFLCTALFCFVKSVSPGSGCCSPSSALGAGRTLCRAGLSPEGVMPGDSTPH